MLKTLKHSKFSISKTKMDKLIPFNNVSFLSSNQLEHGIAFWGWNKYDAGELSIIIVLLSSRPSFDKSFT